MSSREGRKAPRLSGSHQEPSGHFPMIRARDIYVCPVRRSASRSHAFGPDEGNILMPHAACSASSVFVQGGFVRSRGLAPARS